AQCSTWESRQWEGAPAARGSAGEPPDDHRKGSAGDVAEERRVHHGQEVEQVDDRTNKAKENNNKDQEPAPFLFPYYNVKSFLDKELDRDFCSEFWYLYSLLQLGHHSDISRVTPIYAIRSIQRWFWYPLQTRIDGYTSVTDNGNFLRENHGAKQAVALEKLGAVAEQEAAERNYLVVQDDTDTARAVTEEENFVQGGRREDDQRRQEDRIRSSTAENVLKLQEADLLQLPEFELLLEEDEVLEEKKQATRAGEAPERSAGDEPCTLYKLATRVLYKAAGSKTQWCDTLAGWVTAYLSRKATGAVALDSSSSTGQGLHRREDSTFVEPARISLADRDLVLPKKADGPSVVKDGSTEIMNNRPSMLAEAEAPPQQARSPRSRQQKNPTTSPPSDERSLTRTALRYISNMDRLRRARTDISMASNMEKIMRAPPQLGGDRSRSLVFFYSLEFWFVFATLVEKEYRGVVDSLQIDTHMRQGWTAFDEMGQLVQRVDRDDPPPRPVELQRKENSLSPTNVEAPAAGAASPGDASTSQDSTKKTSLVPSSPPTLLDEQLSRSERHALLHLMRGVHELCEAFRFPYLLSSGTLLGAIRHHSLIPWTGDAEVSLDYSYFGFVLNVALLQSLRQYVNPNYNRVLYSKSKMKNTEDHEQLQLRQQEYETSTSGAKMSSSLVEDADFCTSTSTMSPVLCAWLRSNPAGLRTAQRIFRDERMVLQMYARRPLSLKFFYREEHKFSEPVPGFAYRFPYLDIHPNYVDEASQELGYTSYEWGYRFPLHFAYPRR
ncbi:unnamed protein product, partial [Amoebophrya sp. A120]